MFCTSCGSSTAGLSFCSNCGAAVVSQTAAPQAAAQQTYVAPAPTQFVQQPVYNNTGYVTPPPAGYIPAPPQMTFGEAVSKFFRDYATFSGRSRRSEYWFQYLFLVIVSLATSFFMVFDAGITYWLTTIAFFIPSLAAISRRLHDVGKSFGYFFFFLIPIVGWILLIVWLATDSDRGPNRYGNSVKY